MMEKLKNTLDKDTIKTDPMHRRRRRLALKISDNKRCWWIYQSIMADEIARVKGYEDA
jgi:hypothetical protein